VGEIGGTGDGEGVRAKGLSGIWPTDFRLDGECKVLVLTCNLCLCLSPCNDDGLVVVDDVCINELVVVVVTGEQGPESAGLDESDCGSGLLVECLRTAASPDLNDWRL
jgi:hypothetical protein